MNKEKEKGIKYCLRLLSVRSRSVHEIRERLTGKGYTLEYTDEILKELQNEGLLNDLKFAEEWIDARLRTSPKAVRVLKMELIQKGVFQGVIDEVFLKREDDLKDSVIAEEIARRKLESIGNGSESAVKVKLFRFLTGKGFDPEISEETIYKVCEE